MTKTMSKYMTLTYSIVNNYVPKGLNILPTPSLEYYVFALSSTCKIENAHDGGVIT